MIYHASDCLATAVEISNASLSNNKFTELMSHSMHNLALSKEGTTTQTLSASMAENTVHEPIISKSMAMRGFDLLCTHIANYSTDKPYFMLVQMKQDTRRYSMQYALRLLLTISRKSRVTAIHIAKAIAETAKFKGISTATKMVSVLNDYSMHCDKSNRYQSIFSLADCSGWLNDMPPDTHDTI